jgi:transitional endoplasmic reticulum ATPase
MEQKSKTVHKVNIVRSGSTLIVPQHLSYKAAAKLCMQMHEQDEEIVSVQDDFPCFVWEGALALRKAMERHFGVALTQSKMTMMGPIKPKEIQIAVGPGPNEKVSVVWGQMVWPLTEAKIGEQSAEYLETTYGEKHGRMTFTLGGQIKRKWLPEFKKVTALIREIILNESIYRARAVRISFTDAKGETLPMPVPEFLDLSKANLEDIVYPRVLENTIRSYIMTPLQQSENCRKTGIPLKRGVLAAGPYGTGKTLLAQAVGKVGNENGWTFLYIKESRDLATAVRFAEQYQPCVVFAEDVDNATDAESDQKVLYAIRNTLDGIDNKNVEIMTILTTNFLERVSPSLLRPGRLDVVINVTPPDAEAAERLIRIYGRNLIAENADLRKVGEILEGQTPAVIREATERSKLAALMRTGDPKAVVLPEDLEIAALNMRDQQNLLKRDSAPRPHPAHFLIEAVTERVTPEVVKQVTPVLLHEFGKELDQRGLPKPSKKGM